MNDVDQMPEKMPRHPLPEYFKLLRRPEYSGRTALIMKELDSGNYDWAEIARRGDTAIPERPEWRRLADGARLALDTSLCGHGLWRAATPRRARKSRRRIGNRRRPAHRR